MGKESGRLAGGLHVLGKRRHGEFYPEGLTLQRIGQFGSGIERWLVGRWRYCVPAIKLARRRCLAYGLVYPHSVGALGSPTARRHFISPTVVSCAIGLGESASHLQNRRQTLSDFPPPVTRDGLEHVHDSMNAPSHFWAWRWLF